MLNSLQCSSCQLRFKMVEKNYEARLNSMADTFLNLLSNFQNCSLFRGFQGVQLEDNRTKLQTHRKTICNYRMQYLKNVIEGIIHQNQENTIKKLLFQNSHLKNQNYQLQNTLSSFQSSLNNDLGQKKYSKRTQSNLVLQRSEQFEILRSQKQQNQNKSKKCKQNYKNQAKITKLLFKSYQQQIGEDSQSNKTFDSPDSPDSTSFAVNLKQNGSENLSNNCISSIDPASDSSSFPSSQHRSEKEEVLNEQKKKEYKFSSSLREQLQKMNYKQRKLKIKSLSNKSKQVMYCIDDKENEQCTELFEQYQFKYLKF